MDEAAIGKRIRDLIGVILSSPLGGQPSTGSGPGICQPETSTKEASLTTSLDHLRLQVKYLLFDLEATRRENRYLRQMLESRHKRDFDDMKGEESP